MKRKELFVQTHRRERITIGNEAEESGLDTTLAGDEAGSVKYDRIGSVLINVVEEQQQRIEAQQREIDELRTIILELRR
jgi:hypothetical protein